MITTIVIAVAGIIIGIVMTIVGELAYGLGIIFVSLIAGLVVYSISKLKQKQLKGKKWRKPEHGYQNIEDEDLEQANDASVETK